MLAEELDFLLFLLANEVLVIPLLLSCELFIESFMLKETIELPLGIEPDPNVSLDIEIMSLIC